MGGASKTPHSQFRERAVSDRHEGQENTAIATNDDGPPATDIDDLPKS